MPKTRKSPEAGLEHHCLNCRVPRDCDPSHELCTYPRQPNTTNLVQGICLRQEFCGFAEGPTRSLPDRAALPAKEVITALPKGQEYTADEIASRCGRSPYRVRRVLNELVRAGDVRVRVLRNRRGQPKRYEVL